MLDLKSFPGIIRKDETLSGYSFFGTGGIADYFVFPEDLSSISKLLLTASRHNVPHMVIGKASNVLFSDKGFRGLVIRLNLLKEDFSVKNNIIHAPAGRNLNDLIEFSARHSLSGIEFLSGIPGTVGGAICMNAGSPEKGIGQVVETVNFVDGEGQSRKIAGKSLEFGYRRSFFSEQKDVITGCTIALIKEDRDRILNNIRSVKQKKKQTQPLDCRTLGSVFKNYPGHKAWKLIESSGCRGLKIGEIEVSEKHCNFFVNRRKGNSKDMVELIKLVKHRVYEKHGIELEPEIMIIDEYGEKISI